MKRRALSLLAVLAALSVATGYAAEGASTGSFPGAGGVPAEPSGTGGPDDYGYTWIDGDEPGGPVFEWVDITGIGTEVTGLGDDNSVGPFPIGFEFPYYWYTVDQFYVGSNGWISFSSGQNFAHPFHELPNDTLPNDLLAICSGDIDYTKGGTCYYYTSPGFDTLVVSFHDVPEFRGGDTQHTFQVILSRADSTITYQYGEQIGNFGLGGSNAFSMGMENSTGTIGLSYYYNDRNTPPPDPPPFADSTVILFVPPDTTSFTVNDIGVINAVTELGQGLFFDPDSAVTLWSDLKNFGNQTEDLYGASAVITDEQQTTVYSDSIISTTPIAPSEVEQFLFEDPFLALAEGVYAASFGGHLPPGVDLVPENDVLTVELNAVRYPADLAYDDGIEDDEVSWSGDFSGFGNEFIPPVYPVKLERALINTGVQAPGEMGVFIYDDDGPGGIPGTILASDTVFVNSAGWQTIDFSDENLVFEEGKFFIGGVAILQSTISFRMDQNPPLSRRGWEFTGGWAPSRWLNQNDVMIRAGVNYVLDSIADAKADGDGDFVPDSLGAEVFVSGVLTAAAEHFGPAPRPVFLQDETAGIALISDIADTIPDRAEIIVRGILGQRNGLTTIEDVDLFDVVRFGAPLPEQVDLAAADLADETGEDYEALFATLSHVRILAESSYPPEGEDGTILVVDMLGDTATVYISQYTDIDGTATPHDTLLAITGVVGQSTTSVPPSDGYQLMPRGLSDIEFAVGVEDDEPAGRLPLSYTLSQNYPNPFNPQTTVRYDVPLEGNEEGTRVLLTVYSLRGRLVRTLVDEEKEAGSYTVTWDGRDEDGIKVASGIYLLRMEAGSKHFTRKMVLTK